MRSVLRFALKTERMSAFGTQTGGGAGSTGKVPGNPKSLKALPPIIVRKIFGTEAGWCFGNKELLWSNWEQEDLSNKVELCY